MFCNNCGSNIGVNEVFCSNCGSKITRNTFQEHPEYGLKCVYVMSFAKQHITNMLFFKDGILIAYKSKEAMKSIMTSEANRLKAEGVGLIKRAASQSYIHQNYVDKYMQMTKDNIIIDAPNSFFIAYNQIAKFKFTSTYTQLDTYKEVDGDIVIKCQSGKYKFSHKFAKNKKLTNSLRMYLGNSLSIH